MANIEQAIREGTSNQRRKMVRGIYDFAVDGGLVSTIALMGDTKIPSGATIVGGWIEVHTQLTSGGSATIAVQVESAGDICAATAVASWTTGLKSVLPALDSAVLTTASKTVRTTAKRDISAVIAVAALTAGKFSVILEYVDPLF